MASAVVTTGSRGREGEGHGTPQHHLGVSGAGVCAVMAAHTRTAVTLPGQAVRPQTLGHCLYQQPGWTATNTATQNCALARQKMLQTPGRG